MIHRTQLTVPIAALAVILGWLVAQEPVRARDAARRVGQAVIVEDSVAEVTRPQGAGAFYLNFGAPYPRQVLSAVVPTTGFPDVSGWTGRRVRVRGSVSAGADGPVILCSESGQVELLGAGAAATTQPQPARACCRVCRTGKACGNSCIARNRTCRQPPGCACDG
jgi:hypothetical protein